MGLKRITETGPPLPEETLGAFERVLGASLPAAYRRFLLETNGGRPEPNTIDVLGLFGSPTDVLIFFGLGRSHQTSCVDMRYRSFIERGDPKFLHIADDSCGNKFVLSLAGDDRGGIYFAELGLEKILYPVAPDFDRFTEMLREFRSSTTKPS